jgi:hypothetical protein
MKAVRYFASLFPASCECLSSQFTGHCWNTNELNIHNCIRLLGHDWTSPPPSSTGDDFDFACVVSDEKPKVTQLFMHRFMLKPFFNSTKHFNSPSHKNVVFSSITIL